MDRSVNRWAAVRRLPPFETAFLVPFLVSEILFTSGSFSSLAIGAIKFLTWGIVVANITVQAETKPNTKSFVFKIGNSVFICSFVVF